MNTAVIFREHDLRRVPAHLLDALQIRAGVSSPVATYRPVVAVTLTRGPDAQEVLVVVRDGQENLTHPDVVSSPTRRLHGHDVEVEVLGRVSAVSPHIVPEWLQDEVRALLIAKVGLTVAEVSALRGSAVQVWQGESIIALEGTQVVAEPLTMINVHVGAPASVLVPEQTRSHSRQQFVRRSAHRAAFISRDARTLFEAELLTEPPLVYGLCTQSTTAMLALLETQGT